MKIRQLGSLSRTLVAVISASMVLCAVPVFAADTAEVAIEETVIADEAAAEEVVADEAVGEAEEAEAVEAAEEEQPIFIGKSSISSAVIRKITVSTNGGVITSNSPFLTGEHTYTYTWTGQMRPIKLPGKKVTDNAGCISREGYTFNGWLDENGKKYNKITGKTQDAVKVTADWKENTYSLQYKLVAPAAVSGNKAKLTGKSAVKAVKGIAYSAEVELSTGEGFEADGYKLIGWSTRAGEKEAMFALGAKVKGIGGQNKASRKITLYPVWQSK